MSDKTHYRRVLKSNHLGVADLEDLNEAGIPLVFTIDRTAQELGVSVAGRKGDFNIAYFKDKGVGGKVIKPLVLNATNAKIVKKFANSPFIEDWKKIPIQVYIDDSVMLMGERVGGVRIMDSQPKMIKPELTPDHKGWNKAIDSYINNGNLDLVLKKMTISRDNQELLLGQAQDKMDGVDA